MVFLGVGLAGCKDDETIETPASKLEARAGDDQTVVVNTPVTLDGSASSDGNGKTFTYQWTILQKPSGSDAQLQQAATPSAAFTPDVAGTYLLELEISNASGEDTDEVSITASSPTQPTETVMIDDDINQNRVLVDIFSDPATPDYIVSAHVNVNARLEVEPGVVVAFEEDKGLSIRAGGSLKGIGTEERKIEFRGIRLDFGFWQGITFISENEDNELRYTQISGAGSSTMYGMEQPAALGMSNNVASFLKLSYSTIQLSKETGIMVADGARVEMDHNLITRNGGDPLILPVNQTHQLGEHNLLSDNEKGNHVVLKGNRIELAEAVSWRPLPDGAYYLLLETVDIISGLHILPGSRLHINPGQKIRVKSTGYLHAQGTAAKPIVFTGTEDSNIVGYDGAAWGGIEIGSASDMNILEHTHINNTASPEISDLHGAVTVLGSGSSILAFNHNELANHYGYSLYLEDGAVLNSFNNNNFHDNHYIPVSMPVNQLHQLHATSLIFTNNLYTVIRITGGTFEGGTNYVLPAFDGIIEYYIESDVTLQKGINLEPGTRLGFGSGAMLMVGERGYLSALGTEEKPIIFTKYTFSEDPYWGGILFNSTNNWNRLHNCHIWYAGEKDLPGFSGVKANVGIGAGGKASVQNSTIKLGKGWGIAAMIDYGSQVNEDIETANTFEYCYLGNVKLSGN